MATLPYSSRLGKSLQQVARLPTWVDLFLIGLVGGMFVFLALVTAINHDEDQYLAGAVLAWDRLIFRDFMHLQTPLQAWLFAPVTALAPNHALIALRVANALMALLALVGTYFAQRCAGVGGRIALVTTLLLAACPAFRISATVVRNDMVPLAFSAFGIAVSLLAMQRGSGAAKYWLMAGLLFGLATSAKISHAFLPAGVGLFLLWQVYAAAAQTESVRSLLAYSAGGILGLLPTIIVFLAAPAAVRFGVIDYFGPGVIDWYQRNGHADMLTVRSNLTRMFDYLADSPGLPALGVLLVMAVVGYRHRAHHRPEIQMLGILLVTGGIAALLPTPSWTYYLLTFLLPLFILLGVVLKDGFKLHPTLTMVAAAVTILSALPPALDYAKRSYYALHKPPREWRMIRLERQARWIGSVLRQSGARGPIASLSPFAILDSGYPIDPRFATGVFVFRSGHLVSAEDHQRFHTVGPQTLRSALDGQPPAAIVTGYENGSKIFAIRPDDELRRYAVSRGYRLYRSPVGKAELFVPPVAPAVRTGHAQRR